MILCLPYYVQDIGWTLKNMTFLIKYIYQDNKSAMILEKSFKASKSKRKNHMSTIYHFLTDRTEKYELLLESCPTAYMIGYFMMKPNQGMEFNRFRDQLMGVTDVQDPNPVKSKRL